MLKKKIIMGAFIVYKKRGLKGKETDYSIKNGFKLKFQSNFRKKMTALIVCFKNNTTVTTGNPGWGLNGTTQERRRVNFAFSK